MDRHPHIRHIYVSLNGHYAVVAEFEQHVQVWELVHSQRIAAFETTLDFGGQRIAITNDGTRCVAGAFSRRGIAVYDVSNGQECWRRSDLTGVHYISIALDQKRAHCGFENRGFESLNIETGKSKNPIRGVKQLFESEFEPVRVCVKKGKDYVIADNENRKLTAIARETFAPLAFAFMPGHVVVSESRGRIRCHNLESGQLVWYYQPEGGTHALDLAFNVADNSLVGLIWPYRNGGAYTISSFSIIDGSQKSSFTIDRGLAFAFFSSGSKILASDGTIRDCSNGRTLGVLDFFPNGKLP